MGGFARYRVICAACSVPWKLIPTPVPSKNPPTPSARIHPDHTASKPVAAKLGLDPTGKLDGEGEMIWK